MKTSECLFVNNILNFTIRGQQIEIAARTCIRTCEKRTNGQTGKHSFEGFFVEKILIFPLGASR